MTPEAILAAITAVANAVAEGFRFAQTPHGGEVVKQAIEDRAAWDKGVKELGAWVTKLFAQGK